MKVELLHNTPLGICSTAIRTCWDSHHLSDSLDLHNCGQKDLELIDRVGNKAKHESVKNHITYNFKIEDITTKTLLALTRHDIGVEFSVQSTRYTTKKLVKNNKIGYTETKTDLVNQYLAQINEMIKDCVDKNLANDDISMLLPQAWHYSLVCTMSLQALQHFLQLRTKTDAHWDIQQLAHKMYEALPEDHKFLFTDYINIGE